MKEKRRSRCRRAVGLEYELHGAAAPTISVKGENLMADEIVKIARRYGVPIVHDEELARALSAVQLDTEIPQSLFEAVAVLLNSIDQRLGTGNDAVFCSAPSLFQK